MRTPKIVISLTLLAIFGCSISSATEINIPFPVYADQFKVDAKERGFDLYDGDGFVENKGDNFKVFTYKAVTDEQLEIIKDLTWKNMRK